MLNLAVTFSDIEGAQQLSLEGGIALTNEQIDELAKLVTIGTRVVISD